MTIYHRTLQGPTTLQDWLILAAILITVLLTMEIAAGPPAAGLALIAAAAGYVVDGRFFLPLAVALVGVLVVIRRSRGEVRPSLRRTAGEGILVSAGLVLY